MCNKFAAAVWVWIYFLVFSALPISWSLPILHNLAVRWSSTFDVSNLQSIKVNCAKWGFLGFCKVQQKKACSSKNGGETSIDFLFKNKCRRVLFYQLDSLKIFSLDTRCHIPKNFFCSVPLSQLRHQCQHYWSPNVQGRRYWGYFSQNVPTVPSIPTALHIWRSIMLTLMLWLR